MTLGAPQGTGGPTASVKNGAAAGPTEGLCLFCVVFRNNI